ncbi:MAG: hypothetical protein Q4F41_13080 [Eubacteriales bacterium]|nr:hypothetical protein [Eubacteriales bacterium]
MNNALNRAVIETIVRREIKNIHDSPERTTRNLIDLGRFFTEGRFQNLFFQAAQNMLGNENSAYYRLISDVTSNVDTERLVSFGLNLGYNSCTFGADTIRTLESQEHSNIPWSITLSVSGQIYGQLEEVYRSVLEQGKNLGIYTWMIYAQDGIEPLLELLSACPDCAFVLYCSPEEITDSILDEFETLHHVMFAVRWKEGAEAACQLLRARHFLYSVFYVYGEWNAENIRKDTVLCELEHLHPVFTAFVPETGCSGHAREAVYRYICQTRKTQAYPMLLWDPVHDTCLIDRIISEDACLAGFDSDGYLCTFHPDFQRLDSNLFRQPLASIFKREFPKSNKVAP